VQVSIAGIIITNMLFNTGLAIAVGSLRHGRINFSKEYANQFAELLFIAVAVLALPSIAYRLNLSAGLFSTSQFQISPSEASTLTETLRAQAGRFCSAPPQFLSALGSALHSSGPSQVAHPPSERCAMAAPCLLPAGPVLRLMLIAPT